MNIQMRCRFTVVSKSVFQITYLKSVSSPLKLFEFAMFTWNSSVLSEKEVTSGRFLSLE